MNEKVDSGVHSKVADSQEHQSQSLQLFCFTVLQLTLAMFLFQTTVRHCTADKKQISLCCVTNNGIRFLPSFYVAHFVLSKKHNTKYSVNVKVEFNSLFTLKHFSNCFLHYSFCKVFKKGCYSDVFPLYFFSEIIYIFKLHTLKHADMLQFCLNNLFFVLSLRK